MMFNPLALAWPLLALVIWAGSLWKAYELGGADNRAALETERAARATESADRSRAALKYVETQTAQLAQVEQKYAKSEKQRLADLAGVNDVLASVWATAADQDPAPGNAGNSAGATPSLSLNGTGGLERDLSKQCERALVALANTADRLENKVVGLQDYIKAIQAAK